MGECGASEAELTAAEARLGVPLPPSYRSFLAESNGLESLGLPELRVRPVADVAWLSDDDPELIRIWLETGGADEALANTLVAGDSGDGAWLLLDPNAVGADGEWEAWFFAAWVPGAEVYPSFDALVRHLRAELDRFEAAERGEPTPAAAPSLGVEGTDREGLVAALRRPAANDRRLALVALANLRDPATAPAVVALLADTAEDDDLRATAARALGDLRTPEAAAALLEILRTSSSVDLKHAARQGLLRQRDVGFGALAAAVADPDPVLRAEAARTLCYAREQAAEAFELVRPLATDEDRDVRLAVVTNVDQLFDSRGEALLRDALADPDRDVRAAAARALAQ